MTTLTPVLHPQLLLLMILFPTFVVVVVVVVVAAAVVVVAVVVVAIPLMVGSMRRLANPKDQQGHLGQPHQAAPLHQVRLLRPTHSRTKSWHYLPMSFVIQMVRSQMIPLMTMSVQLRCCCYSRLRCRRWVLVQCLQVSRVNLTVPPEFQRSFQRYHQPVRLAKPESLLMPH